MKNLTLSKVIKVVLIPFLCLLFIKPTYALSLTPATTNAYGSYMAETYLTTGGSVGVGAGSVGFTFDVINGRAFHFHYNLTSYYSGSIVLSITSPKAFALSDCDIGVAGGGFSSLPTMSTSSATKTFTISVKHTNEIDFVLIYKGTWNANQNNVLGDSTTFTLTNSLTTEGTDYSALHSIDLKLSTCENTLQDLLTQTQNISGYVDQLEGYINTIKTSTTNIAAKLNQLYTFVSQMQTYDLPLDRLKPYSVFGQLLNCPIIYNNKFSLPYYETRSNNLSVTIKTKSEYDITTEVNYAFYIFTDYLVLSNDQFEFFDIAEDSYYNNLITYNVNVLQTIGNYYILKYSFTTDLSYIYLRYTGTTLYDDGWDSYYYSIIPLWIGDEDNDFMSNETRMLLGIDTTDDQMISLLTQILSTLNNMEPGDNETTVVNNYDTTIDEINITIDDLFSDFDITFNGVDAQLDNVNPTLIRPRLQKASDFVQQVYIAITTEFPEISIIIIISFVIAVIGVLMP